MKAHRLINGNLHIYDDNTRIAVIISSIANRIIYSNTVNERFMYLSVEPVGRH